MPTTFAAYALGRYGQLIGVAKALTQGIGGKVSAALNTAIKLEPKHADAHRARHLQRRSHRKVGSMISQDDLRRQQRKPAVEESTKSPQTQPDSAIARTEMADGL